MKTIYEQLKEAGIPLDHHESDLYALLTPESTAIISKWSFLSSVTTFKSQVDGKTWYDLPFAFQPFWDKYNAWNRIV